MPVAGRRNHAATQRRQFPLNPLAMRRQNAIDECLIALRIAVPGHLALEIDRADDIRE